MIHVIITVHNRIGLTLKCVRSLMKQKNSEKLNIFVVDDGSTDHTSKILSRKFPDVNLIKGSGLLYWCGAVSLGIVHVLKIASKNDWILLVNNDAELKSDAIYQLTKCSMKKNRKAIVSALTLNSKDEQTIIKSGTIIKSWFLNITHHVYKNCKYNELKNYSPIEVDLITARCLLHPIEIFKKTGNYDYVNFNHYGGDDEFSLRVKKFGYKVLLCPTSVVFLEEKQLKKQLNFKRLYFDFFNIKSSSNIINKFKLSFKVVPYHSKLTFFFIGILKSFYVFFRR